ncbi:E domain-containing protein [Mammaliicoccus sp. P-M59]|uniref:E domain-containing protein n=2 Tax=Mammaliicoccus sp. P-M59 TaxID=2898718 RepID=UPI0023BA5202|nr:E domain-containing protein [Mammaliicoccus sp. P-M59]
MKKKPKSRSSKIDFISNRLNKYSIRKFTVGTASILVGATLLFGLSDEAKADEQAGATSLQAQSKNTVNDEDSSEIKSGNSSVSTENANIEEHSTEDVKNSEYTTTNQNVEEASTEDKASDQTAEEASTEDKASEQAAEEASTEDKASDQTAEEASTEDKASEQAAEEVNTEGNTTEQATSEQPVQNNSRVEKSHNIEEANENSAEVQPVENDKSTLVDSIAKDLYNKSEVTEAEKAKIEKVLPKDTSNLSKKEIENIALSESLKETANKRDTQPRATFRSVSSNARTTNLNNSATALRAAAQNTVTKKGTGNFNEYGDIIHKDYNEEFPGEGELTAFNTHHNADTGTKGALEYKNKIDFSDDFTITVPVANNNQGNTTGADGWGFIFTQGTGQDFLNQGGILRDRGIANAAGFKLDMSYNNYRGQKDPLDADKENNIKEIGGASKIGYGTFVKNGADGVTNQVGTNALNSKDKPVNKIQYADNTTERNDGRFHGQRFNDVVLSYNAATSTLTATYAGKTWQATTEQLGIDKSQKYNFLITSSHMQDRYSNGIMRTNLEGITITEPQGAIVDGTPEVAKEKIPYRTVRQFNPDLAPGTERVKQPGREGEKIITTPVKVNSKTGEVVERGVPVTQITTPATDEIIEYGGVEVPPGHHEEFDPNLPVGTSKEVPGRPGVKNPDTGEIVTPPVDSVTKRGPVPGDPIVTKEPIPHETSREFNPDLPPGTERVKQPGKDGEKTTTTPTTKNPLTGEKVGEGDPVTEITTPPTNEIIEYGGEEVPPGHKDEFDPNLPVGETEEVPGTPGVKNPNTGEIVTPPVDSVTKHGPVPGEPIVTKEPIPYETTREFNPDLPPGTERVKQPGKDGEKTTTTPTTKNPLTGEKVGEGDPVTEITTPPTNEIIEYGGEEVPPGHKDEFDPNLPEGETEEVPGKPGIKNPNTGEIVTPPVDSVTKHGPVPGEPIVTKDPIPYETTREFNPDLPPGTERVKQPGKDGEKTTTTPTTKNPLTGEKVGEGDPVTEITTFNDKRTIQNCIL